MKIREINQKQLEGIKNKPAITVPETGLEITREAKRFQRLLDKADAPLREDVIRLALVRVAAGAYADEKVAERATLKLIESGVLNDLL